MGSPWIAMLSEPAQPACPGPDSRVDRALTRLHLVRPWLPATHRNFFVIYTATIIYHLGCGFTGLTNPDGFANPSLVYVNSLGMPQLWAAANLLVAFALFLGLHRETFRWARRALACGLLVTLTRLGLILMAMTNHYDVGNTFWNLFLVASVHVAQTLEPPVNPASR